MNTRILPIILALLFLPAVGWALPQLRTSHPLDPEKPVEARTIAKEKKPFHGVGDTRTLHPIGAKYISLDAHHQQRLIKTYAAGTGQAVAVSYQAGEYRALVETDEKVVPIAQLSALLSQLNAWNGEVNQVGAEAPIAAETSTIHRLPNRPPGEPMETPVGDAPWCLVLLLMVGYGGWKVGRLEGWKVGRFSCRHYYRDAPSGASFFRFFQKWGRETIGRL